MYIQLLALPQTFCVTHVVHVYTLPFPVQVRPHFSYLTGGENECIIMQAVPPNVLITQRKIEDHLSPEKH